MLYFHKFVLHEASKYLDTLMSHSLNLISKNNKNIFINNNCAAALDIIKKY